MYAARRTLTHPSPKNGEPFRGTAKAIDDHRFDRHFKNESEAIRRLIEAGLACLIHDEGDFWLADVA